MSATLSTHRIKRFVLQGRTHYRVSVTAMPSATEQGYAALVGEDWRQVDGLETSLPPHDWLQTAAADKYDAYKFCGDYDADERAQHAFMGAVAYRVAVPADAKTGAACKIEGVSVTAYGCRWLADGAIVAVIPSISATPPTWAEILAAADKTAALMAVTPANDGTDSTATAAVSIHPLDSGVDATTVAYVWVCLRLADYSTHRGAWIEGGAMLDARSMEVTYSRAVTADGPEEDDEDTDSEFYALGWRKIKTPIRTPLPFAAMTLPPNKLWVKVFFSIPDDLTPVEMRFSGNPSKIYINGSLYELLSTEGLPGTMRTGEDGWYLPFVGSTVQRRNGLNSVAFEFTELSSFSIEIYYDRKVEDPGNEAGLEYVMVDSRMPDASTVNSMVWVYGSAGHYHPAPPLDSDDWPWSSHHYCLP